MCINRLNFKNKIKLYSIYVNEKSIPCQSTFMGNIQDNPAQSSTSKGKSVMASSARSSSSHGDNAKPISSESVFSRGFTGFGRGDSHYAIKRKDELERVAKSNR